MQLAITLILIAACSGPTMAPVERPGQVVVSGDTTFRTREGGAIDVSVKRAFRDHDATGTATLRGMTMAAAQRSALVGVAAARAWISIVEALGPEPAAAYEAARNGVDELGTEYRGGGGSRHIIDDTGHAILHASVAAEAGDHASAAAEVTEVLRERVAIYLRVFKGDVE